MAAVLKRREKEKIRGEIQDDGSISCTVFRFLWPQKRSGKRDGFVLGKLRERVKREVRKCVFLHLRGKRARAQSVDWCRIHYCFSSQDLFRVRPWYWDPASRRTPRGQNANSTYQTSHPTVRSFLAHISILSSYWNTSYTSAYHIRPQRDPSQKFTFTETCRRHPRM